MNDYSRNKKKDKNQEKLDNFVKSQIWNSVNFALEFFKL